MVRASITPFPLDRSFNTSHDTLTQATSPTSPAVSPTVARTPSSSFQSVARLFDISCADREPMPQPRPHSASASSLDLNEPILTLKLSGPSFLDTVIWDRRSKEPLYIIETDHERTHIYRLDPQLREAGKAASIQWPPLVSASTKAKGRTGKTIQMGSGAWRDVEDVLKLGPLGGLASRKFNLPHYPHTLKWKLIPGNAYSCVTSGKKGPIAVLDAAVLSAPPRIRIFHTLVDGAHGRSQGNHHGIPFLLLDYLIATALLLCTTTQEWLDRPATVHLPGSSSYTVRRWLALIHNEPLPPEPAPEAESQAGLPYAQSHRPDDPHTPTTPFSPTTMAGSPWDTQSGVTSWSGGSGSGSGSGSSDHPVTPSTPATSSISSYRHGGGQDDIPPVPPLPRQESQSQPSQRLVVANPTPSRPPSVAAHPTAPHSSTSAPPYFHDAASPVCSSPSAGYTHPFAFRASSPQSASAPRQLPPIPQILPTSPSPQSTVRASLRRSIRGMPPPPPPPPHAAPLPLPPKLAAEAQPPRSVDAGPSSAPEPPAPALDEEARMAREFRALSVAERPASADVHTDAGGVRASTAYPPAAEAYEMPPPAYDAIDFSVRMRVPRARRR